MGEWLIEPELNRVSDQHQSHRLQPQLIQLLCYLAAHPLEMLSRERLLSEVWEREFVNDEVLSRSIAILRQTLDDDARQPSYIETIPRKGYRLLQQPALISPASAEHPASSQRTNYWSAFLGLGLLAVLLFIWLQPSGFNSDQVSDNVTANDPTRAAINYTSQPGIERSADISVDGRQLLYVRNKPGGSDIYLGDNQPGTHQLLIKGSGYLESPVFSPDQAQVAYLYRQADGCSVMLFTIQTRRSEPIGSCWNNPATTIAWSHDGRRLVYSYDAPVGVGLALLDLASMQSKVLTHPDNPQHTDSGARFSPDDRYVSFTRGNQIIRELYQLELNAADGVLHAARRLTFDQQLVNGHDWVDIHRLVYASDKQAFQALWLLRLDTLEVSYLGARRARNPVYNLRLNQLVYEQWQYQANIWSLKLHSDSDPKPLIVSNRYDNQPVFSPDNSTLAFCSNRTGVDSLWLANSNGSGAHIAYSVADARVARPAWSPDGERLIVSVYGEQGSQLHELTSQGELVRVINWAGEHAYNAVYHPDGLRLLYIQDTPETSELWAASLVAAGHARRRIGTVSANRVQVSRGGQVLYTRPAMDGIFSVQLDTLQQKPIVPGFSLDSWNHWLVVNESIVYADSRGIWKMAVTGGEPNQLTGFVPTAIGITMAMSNDEQTLLVTRTDAAEIDLMLSQLLFAHQD